MDSDTYDRVRTFPVRSELNTQNYIILKFQRQYSIYRSIRRPIQELLMAGLTDVQIAVEHRAVGGFLPRTAYSVYQHRHD